MFDIQECFHRMLWFSSSPLSDPHQLQMCIFSHGGVFRTVSVVHDLPATHNICQYTQLQPFLSWLLIPTEERSAVRLCSTTSSLSDQVPNDKIWSCQCLCFHYYFLHECLSPVTFRCALQLWQGRTVTALCEGQTRCILLASHSKCNYYSLQVTALCNGLLPSQHSA